MITINWKTVLIILGIIIGLAIVAKLMPLTTTIISIVSVFIGWIGCMFVNNRDDK